MLSDVLKSMKVNLMRPIEETGTISQQLIVTLEHFHLKLMQHRS